MTDLPVLWAGQFTDPTGYGEEARSFVLACQRVGRPIAVEDWPAFEAQVETTSDQERALAAARARVPQQPYVNVWHKRPPVTMKAIPYGHGPTVIRTMFETDALPAEWLPALERVDQVWVPTRFNLETFARGGVPEGKLRLLPQTLDFSLFDPDGVVPLPRPAGARGFCFLSVFAFSYRKGWDVLLDAWCTAFDPDEDVCLILKVTDLRRSAAPAERVAAYLDARAHAPIVWEPRTLGAGEMPRLYAACDAYVGASRGEGWGRPYMEAMAMGLPTIASRWSGNVEFTTDENSFLVEGELVEVASDSVDGYFRGSRWFEPDRDQLARLLRQVFEGGAAVTQRASAARPSLQANVGEDRVVGRLARLVEDALGRWG
jgi:glycosyltransferase involved in cell wall biosynthesis